MEIINNALSLESEREYYYKTLPKNYENLVFEYRALQDKLTRRNMQIKDLKKELQKTYVTIADLTHPEYKDK